MKLFTAPKMQAIDKHAINDFSIPGSILMENAGRETVRLMQNMFSGYSNGFAPIFIGPGNNGGDGLVIGRHLNQIGCTPLFCFLTDPEKLPTDSLLNYRIVEQTNLPCFHLYESNHISELLNSIYTKHAAGKHCYVIVDAIFGIGLSREIVGPFAEIISIINSKEPFTNSLKKVPIISCDIPSGLDSDTGNILGISVKADITATYSNGKPGLYMNDGVDVAGEVHTLDIGIPESAIEQHIADATLLTKGIASDILNKLPRHANTHKGNNGHILLIAGSEGMTGAAILAAKGCLRAGSGLVSIAVTGKLNSTFEISLPEAMTFPLSSELAYFSEDDFEPIAKAGRTKNALLLGPGLGKRNGTAALIRRLYRESSLPMVVDADAINILADNPETLLNPSGPRIFTPHPGEMSRLLQISTGKVQNDRLKTLKDFLSLFENNRNEIILVLKGPGTLIGSSIDVQSTFLNPTGNSGMATGGMGDVLSGVIGGLLCQKLSPFDAAKLGVFIHGMAGDYLLMDKGIGYSAGELGDAIPTCRNSLLAITT